MALKNNLSDIKCVFIISIIVFHDVVPSLARNSAIQNLNREKRQSGHDDA